MAGRWRRIMAVGCTHGHLADKSLLDQVLHFRAQYKPEIRVHLGDLIDTAAFRSGAAGSRDECEPVGPDRNSALEFLEQYEPTHILWGNHDWRLWELASHPKAIISAAATALRDDLIETAALLHAVTAPYDIRRGWIEIGGYGYTHGYMYNMQAVRDHAESWGGPVVMAHIHRPEMYGGRTIKHSPSYCVGTLMDIDRATYAHRRRATLQWAPGLVYGEACDDSSRLHLASGPGGGMINFPPGVL